MLIVTISYSKYFEIIELQQVSAAKSDVARCFLFCKYWRHWRSHYLHIMR